jgi:glucose-1-phosphate cytidylyltransferase
MLTYGDGVGAVDIPASIVAHRESGKVCTLTAVHPPGRFGELGLEEDSTVRGFNEKPQTEAGYINGGYMVCNAKLFDYLTPNPAVMLEQEPIRRLAAEGQLGAYKHKAFWQPMDTFQEFTFLNTLWREGRAPWKLW